MPQNISSKSFIFKYKYIIILLCVILLLAVVIIVYVVVANDDQKDNDQNNNYSASVNTTATTSVLSSDIVIKNLGIDTTKLVFNKDTILQNANSKKIFYEFGAKLQTNEGQKQFPEIIFNQVTLDTPVIAIADGIKVVEVRLQPESNDYAISILINDTWVVNYDHVKNPLVQLNDKNIKAGQQIGTVSPNRDGKTGFIEISLKSVDKNNKATYYCVLDYMSDVDKSKYQANLQRIMQNWEQYTGDSSIYDEASMYKPGCVIPKYSD